MKRNRWVFAFYLVLLLVPRPTRAEEVLEGDQELEVLWSVIAGGGWESSSDEWIVEGTAGQAAPGFVLSDTLAVAGGYWGVVDTAASFPASSAEMFETTRSREAGQGEDAALDFAMGSITPNPSRGRARIAWSVPRPSSVRLTVHDVQGRRVALLVEGLCATGRHAVEWRPERIPPGIYFARLQTEAGVFVRRVLLLE